MLENTHLFKELHEQPEVVKRFYETEWANLQRISQLLQDEKITQVVIAARGTSDNAARYAQYIFGAFNHLPVALAAPSLHTIYKQRPIYKNSLVIGISQSGKSPDVVSVITDARKSGCPTLAITNEPYSDLARSADELLDLHAGEEHSVVATKTYTAGIAAIAGLSALASKDKARQELLKELPAMMAKTLGLAPKVAETAQRYRFVEKLITVGRGFNYATAYEIALKIQELNYILSEPYSSADFIHGPIAVVEEAFPVIVVAPSGKPLAELKAFVKSMRARRAEVLAISDDDSLLQQAQSPLKLPVSCPEWASPLLSVLPGQLLAMYLAEVRELSIDQPRGLRKVTETV